MNTSRSVLRCSWEPLGGLWASWRPRGPLGPSGVPRGLGLGGRWGASRAHLGSLLEPLVALLGVSWALGTISEAVGLKKWVVYLGPPSGAMKSSPGALRGRSWAPLGSSWGPLGRLLGLSRAILGQS